MWDLAYREDFKPDVALRLVENALAFPTATVCCVCDREGRGKYIHRKRFASSPTPLRERAGKEPHAIKIKIRSVPTHRPDKKPKLGLGGGGGYVGAVKGWNLSHVVDGM